MLEFSFLYGLNVLLVVSSDISRKLHLVAPTSVVILKPSSLKVFIVFLFSLSSSWLLYLVYYCEAVIPIKSDIFVAV